MEKPGFTTVFYSDLQRLTTSYNGLQRFTTELLANGPIPRCARVQEVAEGRLRGSPTWIHLTTTTWVWSNFDGKRDFCSFLSHV